jgi:hypothetical protein
MGNIIRADARKRIASMNLYADIAPWPAPMPPEPAVSLVQALCMALEIATINVTLFVWLVGAA